MTPKLIDQIDGPADLKGLNDEQLTQVAQEVRELIIDTIGEIGGHFGANLGACEIAVAIHSLLEGGLPWKKGNRKQVRRVVVTRQEHEDPRDEPKAFVVES